GRAGTAAAAAALGTGLPQRLGRSRLVICVEGNVSDSELPDLVLRHHLARVLGAESVQLAVRVGATRPNGKPVVQVADRSGRVLAYAKVGWNDLTGPLVAAEAAALDALAAGEPPRSFRVARLLHAGGWHGNQLAV